MLDVPAVPARAPRFAGRFSVGRELVRRPAGLTALVVVAVIIVIAIAAHLIAPYNPNAIHPDALFQPPSSAHLLGTDYVGRDQLSRTLFGVRTALEIAIPAVTIAFVAGLFVGLVTGYVGGFVDKVTIVIVDAILSFPALILALVALTLFGPSKLSITVLIAVAFFPDYVRLARALTLAAKQNMYVKAERSLGASRIRIVTRHLAPNILPPLLVLMAIDIPGAIATEAGLAFLGIGIQPPTADLGILLNDGFTYIQTQPWLLVGPLAVLLLLTGAFTVLGETLRDITDPKRAGTHYRRRGPRAQRSTRASRSAKAADRPVEQR